MKINLLFYLRISHISYLISEFVRWGDAGLYCCRRTDSNYSGHVRNGCGGWRDTLVFALKYEFKKGLCNLDVSNPFKGAYMKSTFIRICLFPLPSTFRIRPWVVRFRSIRSNLLTIRFIFSKTFLFHLKVNAILKKQLEFYFSSLVISRRFFWFFESIDWKPWSSSGVGSKIFQFRTFKLHLNQPFNWLLKTRISSRSCWSLCFFFRKSRRSFLS